MNRCDQIMLSSCYVILYAIRDTPYTTKIMARTLQVHAVSSGRPPKMSNIVRNTLGISTIIRNILGTSDIIKKTTGMPSIIGNTSGISSIIRNTKECPASSEITQVHPATWRTPQRLLEIGILTHLVLMWEAKLIQHLLNRTNDRLWMKCNSNDPCRSSSN